jgi:hypothetical protein
MQIVDKLLLVVRRTRATAKSYGGGRNTAPTVGSLFSFCPGLKECYKAVEHVLYFSSLFGFSCRLKEHEMPPHRQAVSVS